MNSLELVSFDADQTLFDFHRTMGEALQEVSNFLAQEYHLAISPELLKSTRDKICMAHKGRAVDMLTIRRMSFSEVVAGHRKKNDIVEGAMQVFKEIRYGRVYLYPNVAEVIENISKKYTLALITNGNSNPELANLEGLFDYILLGEKFTFKKPDPRIFRELFKRASISDPSRVCHVGDSLKNDVRGANSVGSVSVWFNPDRLPNNTNIAPTYEIRSMVELPNLLTTRV